MRPHMRSEVFLTKRSNSSLWRSTCADGRERRNEGGAQATRGPSAHSSDVTNSERHVLSGKGHSRARIPGLLFCCQKASSGIRSADPLEPIERPTPRVTHRHDDHFLRAAHESNHIRESRQRAPADFVPTPISLPSRQCVGRTANAPVGRRQSCQEIVPQSRTSVVVPRGRQGGFYLGSPQDSEFHEGTRRRR